MVWLVILIVVLAIAIALAYPHMKIPREPDREGIQDAKAVVAYDRISRWPMFIIARRLMLNELKKYQPAGIVLDIGCGPGYLAALLSNKFPHLKVLGLDISEEMLRMAKRNFPTIELCQGDVGQLPVKDNTIDFVVSSLSLHHWADARKSIQEINRILRPGGQFLILDARRDCRRFFYYALKLDQTLFAPSAIRRTNGEVGSLWASYTPDELKTILSETSFCSWRVKAQFGWMFAWGRK